MAIDPSTTAVVLATHDNALACDHPMFSEPMPSTQFIELPD